VRFLELLFLASLVLAGVSLFLAPERRPAWLRYQPAVPVTLALVHAFIDNGRWQLYVAYALAGIISLAAGLELRNRDGVSTDRPWIRRLFGTLILVVTLASGALAWEVPVFSLPEPTGTYKVGSRWLVLTDSTRDEDLSPEPGDKRVLIVRVWFPADSVAGVAADYIEDDVARGVAAGLELPPFTLSHLSLVSTHSFRRAWLPATPARFPLILFSHGYGVGTESQNTVQMEELASHGFVVASIDHPYEAGAILMPNDEVLTARLPFDVMGDTTALRRSRDAIARAKAAADTTLIAAAVAEMHALNAPLERSIERWTDDTRFVLDRLTAMSRPHEGPDTLFVGRLETGRVGLLGMSFGGATAASVCVVDSRCAAGMNLDGLLYGAAARAPLQRPFFFAASEDNAQLHRLFHERAQGPSWLMTVRGSSHMDYTDFNWVAPRLLARTGMLGGIAPARMHAIMNQSIVPYFDAALRGGTALDVAAFRQRFPEVTLDARVPAAVPADSSAASVAPLGADTTRAAPATR
jgi:predicted dienelactone hydrolase